MEEHDITIQRYISCVTLTFQVYEWLSSLNFEIAHMWSKSSTSIVKWQYFTSRYLAIIMQGGNVIITNYILLARNVSERTCISYYVFQLIGSQGMLLSLDTSLMLRVFALYRGNTKTIAFVITLVALENITITILGIFSFSTENLLGSCLVKKPPVTIILLAFVIVSTQAVLWTLMLCKCRRKRVPLLSLVIRDGSMVFAAILTMCIGMLANIALSRYGFDIVRVFHSSFSLFITMISSANCHMITNMETMPGVERDPSSLVEFTSIVADDLEQQD